MTPPLGTAIGTVDAGILARVGTDGTLVPAGEPPIDWWVVAEDRVHHPLDEASTRQARLEDTPVVETRVRVPGGDLAATAYAVAGATPLVVVDLENRSPAAVAVAFARAVVADRPLHAPPAGAGLPDGSVLVPVGHRASVRVAVAVGRRGAPAPEVTSVLSALPSPAQVVRGWTAQAAAGPRLVLPGELAALLTRARCDAILDPGALDGADDALLLLGAAFRSGRGGRPDDDGVLDVAAAAGRVARRNRRERAMAWSDAAALDSAAVALAAAGESRAAADVLAMFARLPGAGPLPAQVSADAHPLLVLAWLTARTVRTGADGVELLAGADRTWLGTAVEAHDVPTAFGTVGVAIRWHGERPAILWSCERAIPLSCPALDPAWSTTSASGEALLAVPPASLAG